MSHPIEQLEQIMAKLRDPENGCPWDLKQTFDTIVPHTIEETYLKNRYCSRTNGDREHAKERI